MKLRFTRDETSNDVTFLITKKVKVPSRKHKGFEKDRKTISKCLTLSLENFALALMAGKEVPCKMTSKEKTMPKGTKTSSKR